MSKKAYNQGVDARGEGINREDNPCSNLKARAYWFAGYDGLNYNQFRDVYKGSYDEIKRSLGYSRIGLDNV